MQMPLFYKKWYIVLTPHTRRFFMTRFIAIIRNNNFMLFIIVSISIPSITKYLFDINDDISSVCFHLYLAANNRRYWQRYSIFKLIFISKIDRNNIYELKVVI